MMNDSRQSELAVIALMFVTIAAFQAPMGWLNAVAGVGHCAV
jgi:hypothetical protein